MKIPCKECITLAICKYKSYSELMKCDILRVQLYNEAQDRRLLMINRQNDFHTTLQELDKLFGSSHDDRLISRREMKKIII